MDKSPIPATTPAVIQIISVMDKDILNNEIILFIIHNKIE